MYGSPKPPIGNQVKHILIILSILLLSSPLFGQETGVLYQYETSSGFVWKTFGDGKVQPKYKGEITNGKPNGFGILTYPYGEKSVVGEWKDGKEWNTKHTKKDGTLIGKFENGKWIVSWGVLYFGKRNGELGYYTEKWEGVDSGNNKNISKYEGEIKNGLPNGQGTDTVPKGEKYVGSWKVGNRDGQGTLTWSDGSKFVGEFKNGKRNGQGTETFGKGKWKGDKYVGEYKDDNKNGQGTYTFSNGWKFVVEYKDGEVLNGTFYDKDGNIIKKKVNGKSIKQ